MYSSYGPCTFAEALTVCPLCLSIHLLNAPWVCGQAHAAYVETLLPVLDSAKRALFCSDLFGEVSNLAAAPSQPHQWKPTRFLAIDTALLLLNRL